MPEKGIYILSAPVGSGKTTSLLKWIENRNDVFGILTPVKNGKRFFMDVHSKEEFPMEAEEGEEILEVGRFIFSKKNFERAIQIIRDSIHKEGWLVVDEVGPLELRGEGFHDVLKEVLSQRGKKILLVVREGLVEKVKGRFLIEKIAVFNKS